MEATEEDRIAIDFASTHGCNSPSANKDVAIKVPHFRDDLARWQQLVQPEWLADVVAGKTVAAAPGPDWRLFEVDAGAPSAEFLDGHIPEAAYLDTECLEGGPFWNKLPDAALLQQLRQWGIRHDSTVLLYGRNTTAAGRAAHLLLYAGVQDVRLLDGGLAAWVSAGLPVVPGSPHRYPQAAGFGADFPLCTRYLINTPQLKSLLARPDAVLVSIRTREEFIGRTSGYRYIEARGEIPGARWGRAGEAGDVNSMSAFQNADGRMQPAQAILDVWRSEGIHAGQHTTFYCGTGWRASLAFFYAWLMGWDNIGVYDGGWFEWSSDPANPRQLGSRPAVRQGPSLRVGA